MLPMVSDPANGSFSDAIAMAGNIQLAKAIVAYRDKYGPFTSIFDLNRVYDLTGGGVTFTTNGFMNGWGTLGTMQSTGDSVQMGPYTLDYTNISDTKFPRSVGTAETYNYYAAKDRLNTLARISNLVTTRSDSFTVYVVVEGWKNAGTATATRVSQVRQAYIVDRSQVSGLNKTLNVIPVPTN
jgi:hypothetical protein